MRKESAIIKKIGSMEKGGKDGKSKGQIENGRNSGKIVIKREKIMLNCLIKITKKKSKRLDTIFSITNSCGLHQPYNEQEHFFQRFMHE